MLSEFADRRVVEHRRRADIELAAELPEQPVAQLDGHQRVGAEIQESAGRPGRLGQPQEALDLALQEFGDETHPLRHRHLLELPEQLAVTGRRRIPGGQHIVQKRRANTAEHLRGPLPVGLENRCLPGSVADHLAERGQGRRRLERHHALRSQIGDRGLRARHAAAAPRTEVHRGRRQAPGPAVGGEAVE